MLFEELNLVLNNLDLLIGFIKSNLKFLILIGVLSFLTLEFLQQLFVRQCDFLQQLKFTRHCFVHLWSAIFNLFLLRVCLLLILCGSLKYFSFYLSHQKIVNLCFLYFSLQLYNILCFFPLSFHKKASLSLGLRPLFLIHFELIIKLFRLVFKEYFGSIVN